MMKVALNGYMGKVVDETKQHGDSLGCVGIEAVQGALSTYRELSFAPSTLAFLVSPFISTYRLGKNW